METKILSKKFLNLFGLVTLVVTEGLFVFSLLPEKDDEVVGNVSVVFVTLVVTLADLFVRFVPLGFTDTLVPGCVCFNISFDVLIS